MDAQFVVEEPEWNCQMVRVKGEDTEALHQAGLAVSLSILTIDAMNVVIEDTMPGTAIDINVVVVGGMLHFITFAYFFFSLNFKYNCNLGNIYF